MEIEKAAVTKFKKREAVNILIKITYLSIFMVQIKKTSLLLIPNINATP